MKRHVLAPQVQRLGGVGLGQLAEQLDVPLSALRPSVESGELKPDRRGLYSVQQGLALLRRHPDLGRQL
jgi:hypothetical protein